MLPPGSSFPAFVFFTKRLVHSFIHHSRPQPPKSPPLSLFADKCTSLRQLKQIHAQMILSGRISDNFAASRLLAFCALSNSGDVNYAIKLFESIEEPNCFMWNTLIRAQAGSSDPRKAVRFYMKMRRVGVVPGKYTLPFVLKACYNSNSISCCKQVHTHVVKFGLDFDLHVLNGLVRGYSVLGGLHSARQIFDDSTERNLSVWTTMTCGYAQNGCYDEALRLFDQMIGEGFEPNGATLSSVLSACARSGSLELGEKIHVYMERKGLEMGLILGTALVDMYAKNGAISMGQKLFDQMQEKNIATWNAMICGLASHGHAGQALKVFRRLEKEQVVPNAITLVGVLSACCHAGLVDVGCEIFRSMKKVYGIEPKIEHYGCMVDLLGRAGKLAEAEDLLKGMAWKTDVKILGALLSACKRHGNIEVAERVIKKIIALDPNNHGGLVVLSNMYAEAGRWEDVLMLRKVIKEGNLKKAPGLSLVDDDT